MTIRRSENVLGRLYERLEAERDGLLKPIHLPWPQLNEQMANGFLPGQCTIMVGPPGASKSWMALSVAMCAHKQKKDWRMLPLEQDSTTWARRMLAMMTNKWSVLSVGDQFAEETVEHEWVNMEALSGIAMHIDEFDFAIPENIDEHEYIPGLSWKALFKYIIGHCNEGRLVIVDPITKIDWTANKKYAQDHKEQEQFMRLMESSISKTSGHAILVAHMAKRPGRSERPLTLDDIQGSAGITRFARNVLGIEKHAERESEIWMGYGFPVKHKNTVYLMKTNDGIGTGNRFAFDFCKNGPRLIEHGQISNG